MDAILRLDPTGQQPTDKRRRGSSQVMQIKRFVYAQIHHKHLPQWSLLYPNDGARSIDFYVRHIRKVFPHFLVTGPALRALIL